MYNNFSWVAYLKVVGGGGVFNIRECYLHWGGSGAEVAGCSGSVSGLTLGSGTSSGLLFGSGSGPGQPASSV